MKLKKLSLLIVTLVGSGIFALPIFADSHGNFPGKGSKEAWKRSCDPGNRAVEMAKKKDFQGVIRLSNEAIAIYQFDSSWYHNLGNALTDVGKFEEGRRAHEQAIALEPNFTGAWISLGVTYEKQKRLAEAERYYRKAIEIDPNCWEALGDLGDILRQQGKFDEALTWLSRAKACPENARFPGDVDKVVDKCRRKEALN